MQMHAVSASATDACPAALQRDNGYTLKEVVRILTDINSLVDVSQRIQQLEDRQVCSRQKSHCDCVHVPIWAWADAMHASVREAVQSCQAAFAHGSCAEASAPVQVCLITLVCRLLVPMSCICINRLLKCKPRAEFGGATFHSSDSQC